jgi:phenylalanine-4-hydroxylase
MSGYRSVSVTLAETNATPALAKADAAPVTIQNQTWRVCYEKHLDFLARHAELISCEYLDGMKRLDLPRLRLPTLAEINKKIAATRWSVVRVEGYLPGRTFYQWQAERKIPIASNLRTLAAADYSPQPDMLHDIFGHVPLTFFTDLMAVIRDIALAGENAPVSLTERDLYRARLALSTLKAKHEPDATVAAEAAARVERLEHQALAHPGVFDRVRRVYAWSIEFGLLNTANGVKVIGAGLMSSREELAKFAKGQIPILPFDERVLDYEIDISSHQKQLFLIDDLSQIYRVLQQAIEG